MQKKPLTTLAGMLEMLRTLEVGESFERMITAIYTQQTARIRIHGELTEKNTNLQRYKARMSTFTITVQMDITIIKYFN